MWTIIPDTDPKNYDTLNPKRIRYTYLHGKLEADCGHDCYKFINCELPLKGNMNYVDTSKMKQGIYDCEYKGKKCLLFFWKSGNNKKDQHGLVVYSDDIESIEYATEKYNMKSIRI